MKKRTRIWLGALLTVCLLMSMAPLSAVAAGDTTVAIGSADVLVHGRSYTNNGVLYFDWTNSGISFTVNGTGAKATFTSNSLSPNPVYVNVYVDGDLIARNTILMETTWAEYTLVSGLSAGIHTVTLRKRNEAVYGGSATWGIVDLTAVGGTFGAAPADATRHIEVIGDSITAGFGNLDVGSKLGYSSHTSDGTSTYATLTAASFGADIDVIARSGIKFIRENPSGSMYPVYEQISGLDNKCTDPYDFTSHPKDVVIINLGTNDAGANQPDSYFQSEAKAFVQLVRQNNPNALIVWAYGIMGNGRTDAIQAGIQELVNAGDNKLFFFPLDRIDSALENVGTGNHPTVVTAINRSFDLTAFIASKLGWDYDFDTQLAQMLRIADGYDAAYLKNYSNESIRALKNAIADAKALPATATNDQIKAAVAAIQNAHMGLELALEQVALISDTERTANAHCARLDYTFSEIQIPNLNGRPLYFRFDVKVETSLTPANTTWLQYVRNGCVWLGSDWTQYFKSGLSMGSAPIASATAQSSDWMTVTLEVPVAKIPETLSQVGLYYYNDTGNQSESEKAGVAWDNNSSVTLHVRNVKLMTTRLPSPVSVTFLGHCGETIAVKQASSAVELQELLETTSATALGGYRFVGWSENPADAVSLYETAVDSQTGITVTAIYTQEGVDDYPLTVTGASVTNIDGFVSGETRLTFDTRVTVQADNVLYWVLDGAKVGFGKNTYTFYVSGANVIEAVTEGELPTDPEVVLQQTSWGKGSERFTLTVIAQTSIPSGTVSAYGVAFASKIETLQALQKGESVASGSYLLAPSSKTAANRQYMIHLFNVKPNKQRFAIAYAVVNGQTIYSADIAQFHTGEDSVATQIHHSTTEEIYDDTHSIGSSDGADDPWDD
ncbi:MAG: GDSL-type esterase/lipase family protein [Acutalibacteraceae bacterium]|jgi:hypothetical protein